MPIPLLCTQIGCWDNQFNQNMGLDLNAVRYLLRARKQGVDFGDVLMVGRLLLDVFPAKVAALLQQHGLPCDPYLKPGTECRYAEPFFRCLGARSVSSMDASDYEGATFVHDLNQPVPAQWRERFDTVYDGGTLEHVFNFPVALRNCMEMVKAEGHLFLDAPGNNWFGHGFYQFSPELFYRALSEDNGYEVVEMIAHATGPYSQWYRVADPRAIQSRVELISWTLIHLLVHARRKQVIEIFRQMPQQSDYAATWRAAPSQQHPVKTEMNVFMKMGGRRFPGLAHLLKAAGTGWNFYRSHSLRNRRFFIPIPKE